jgi:orotate phosphoribosyltransferase
MTNPIISQLLEKNIIELSELGFTLVSGANSPIYCDMRKIMGYVELRNQVVDEFVARISMSFPDVEVISGVATGSIALGMMIADRMKLPFIYYRKPKGYAHDNTVEGVYHDGQKVIVIEDVLTTGGSARETILGLQKAGLTVLGLNAIYTHNPLKIRKRMSDLDLPLDFMCDIDDVIHNIEQTQDMSDSYHYEMVDSLAHFRDTV